MPERELVLESLGCTPQNRRLANRLQPVAAAFLAGLPNTGRVCARLGASHIAFSMSNYHSARTASRPSPSGACDGLDPAPAPWSSNQSRRRCGRICFALSYNLVDGKRGHVSNFGIVRTGHSEVSVITRLPTLRDSFRCGNIIRAGYKFCCQQRQHTDD